MERRQGRAQGGRRASSARRAGPRPAARARRSSSTPTRSSSTRTPTSSSRATAGSSACASSRIRTRRDPRGRRGDARAARLDQGEGRLLHQPRLGLRHQDQRHRGDRPATAIRRRSSSSSPTARRSSSAMTLDPRAMVPPTLLAVTRERLRPAVRARAAHRDHDEGRPPLRQARRGRRDPRRGRRATTATSW